MLMLRFRIFKNNYSVHGHLEKYLFCSPPDFSHGHLEKYLFCSPPDFSQRNFVVFVNKIEK